jgi:asparagine synthase (glutamine-hydrolysing)
MSMQAGVWHFDGRPLDDRWLKTMSRELALQGPDGEAVYRAPGLAMLYRPFHTTAESRLEHQPYRSMRGTVMTWDGRLDNRADLERVLDSGLRDDRTDAAIAAAAFDRWGEEAFGRLVGDFALVVWDAGQRRLYLVKDFAGPKPLHYVLTSSSVHWSSRLDPLVLHGGAPWTLDDEWVGTYLMYRPNAYHTPYAEIRTVGPATFARIEPGRVAVRRYWNWDPGRRIRYRTDGDYEEHLLHLFRQAVRRRVRTDTPVLAELSGGVDSSCIVCMADRLAQEGAAETPRIDTITHWTRGDPEGSLPFVTLIEAQRGRPGDRLMIDDAEPPSYVRDGAFPFDPLPGSSSTRWLLSSRRQEAQRRNGNRVVLSGIGGDEVLGGIPYPYGQLADALAQGQLREFASLTQAWSQSKRMPVWHIAAVSAKELFSGRRRGQLLAPLPWLAATFCERAGLARTYPAAIPRVPRGALPSQLVFAAAFESERQILTLHASSMGGVEEKRYPYMDRDLVEFLFSIPNTQLLRPGERRSLLRRSMSRLVPEKVLWRKAKAAQRSTLTRIFSAHWGAVSEAFALCDDVMADYFEGRRLKGAICNASSERGVSAVSLARTIATILWIRDLRERGLTVPWKRNDRDGSVDVSAEAATVARPE